MAGATIFLMLDTLTLFERHLINFVSESYCATQSHIVIVTNKVNVSGRIVHLQGIQKDLHLFWPCVCGTSAYEMQNRRMCCQKKKYLCGFCA